MKIILLASNKKLYSNKRLMEEARNKGHQIEFVNVGDCYIKIASTNPTENNLNSSEIFYDEGKKIENYDWIIPRIKPSMTFYATAIIRQFEMMNMKCLNGSDAITKSRDKLHCLQILASHGFPIPVTSFANSSYDTKDLIKLVGGAPLIVKLLEGTKGVGVVMAETNKAAESVIGAFRSLKADVFAQHYIKESKGQDIRCFVVGDRVVASMQRIAQEGEFRANIHLGATAVPVEITEEEREYAIKTAKIIGLEVAGVDMVRSSFGPKILEINSSPGIEGIENATKINVAAEIIKYLESK